jgi:hypothetical protein
MPTRKMQHSTDNLLCFLDDHKRRDSFSWETGETDDGRKEVRQDLVCLRCGKVLQKDEWVEIG